MTKLTPTENNFLKIAFILILLLAAGGCIQKKNTEKPSVSPSASIGPGGPSIEPVKQTPIVPRTKLNTDTNTNILTRPYFCNDPIIIAEMKRVFGKDHDVARESVRPGVNYANAKCYLRKGGAQTILVFSILEQPGEDYALNSISIEKNQWIARSENPQALDQNFGTEAILLSETDGNGKSYKLVFIDDTNKRVFVEILGTNIIELEKIIEIGKLLNKLI